MQTIGTFLRDHRGLAMLLLALALCMKVLIPQGYMPGSGQKTLTVQMCYDGMEHRTAEIVFAADTMAPGKDRSEPANPHQDGSPDQHCAYSALTMSVLGGADAPLLERALAFIIARGFAPVDAILAERLSWLLPPLRGPPASL